jgi:hypothetical protein
MAGAQLESLHEPMRRCVPLTGANHQVLLDVTWAPSDGSIATLSIKLDGLAVDVAAQACAMGLVRDGVHLGSLAAPLEVQHTYAY